VPVAVLVAVLVAAGQLIERHHAALQPLAADVLELNRRMADAEALLQQVLEPPRMTALADGEYRRWLRGRPARSNSSRGSRRADRGR